MLKELSLLSILLTLTSGALSRTCDSHCPTEFTKAAYCLSNREIYPSICSASCSKVDINILYVCKLNKNQDLRYCSARCKKSNKIETDKLFNGDCKCPRVYNPVCSENGETFFNDCFRICKRFKRKQMKCGFCDEEEDSKGCRERCEDMALGYCDAPEFELEDMSYEPVCGADSKIYANKGLMVLADVGEGEKGSCGRRRLKTVETF